MAQNERLPVNKRRIHRLPCPIHGEFDLHPHNEFAWRLFIQYSSHLVTVQRDYGYKHFLIRPNLPAIESILRVHHAPEDTLDKLLTLLEEGLIPLMH